MINIRKRGSAYQYQFEVEPIDGKRKQITKIRTIRILPKFR